MAVDNKEIARRISDLIDRFVKNDDPKFEATQAEVTRAFEGLFSTILETATPRPIWQWRNFCKPILKEMFPEDDADFYQPGIEPQIASPELSVHHNETVTPFLIDQVFDWVLYHHDDPEIQEFASKVLDDIFDIELLVTIRSHQLFFD